MQNVECITTDAPPVGGLCLEHPRLASYSCGTREARKIPSPPATRHCILMRPVRYSSTLRRWCNRATLVAFATCQSTYTFRKFNIEIPRRNSAFYLSISSSIALLISFFETYFFSIPFNSWFLSFFWCDKCCRNERERELVLKIF